MAAGAGKYMPNIIQQATIRLCKQPGTFALAFTAKKQTNSSEKSCYFNSIKYLAALNISLTVSQTAHTFNMKKKLLYGLLGLIVIAQFIRPSHTNPPINAAVDFVNVANPPAEVLDLMKKACYNCHSDETKYPWYSNVAPISWWMANHINGARGGMNFSAFGTYSTEDQNKFLRKCARLVEKKKMPLPSYTWLGRHPEARLTDAQRTAMVDWFKAAGGPAPEGDKK